MPLPIRGSQALARHRTPSLCPKRKALRLFTMKSEMLCNPEFCGLLKVSPDVYGVNGCAPGHACGEPPARANPEFNALRLITQMA